MSSDYCLSRHETLSSDKVFVVNLRNTVCFNKALSVSFQKDERTCVGLGCTI